MNRKGREVREEERKKGRGEKREDETTEGTELIE